MTNARSTSNANHEIPNLRKGETVVFLGREYRVVSPGNSVMNAELVSVIDPNLIVFVPPTEFPVDLDDSK